MNYDQNWSLCWLLLININYHYHTFHPEWRSKPISAILSRPAAPWCPLPPPVKTMMLSLQYWSLMIHNWQLVIDKDTTSPPCHHLSMIRMIKLIILNWQGQPESSLPTISKMNQHLIKAVDQLQFVHYEQNSMVCHTSKSEGPSAEPRSIVHLMVKKKDLTKIFLPTSFYQLFIAFTAVLSSIIQFSHWALTSVTDNDLTWLQ